MFPLPLKRLRCLLVFVFATATQATILPSPTVTNASPGFQGIYVGSNAVGQGLSEFLSEQGTSTFLEFDFGSARTVDGFVNVTLVLAERSIGANRLIFDTDGTTGFNAATDTVVSFTQAQTGSQGQGYIQRFKAVTAQKVRWEVQALVGSPSLVGTTEMSFLSTQGATVPITGVTVIGSATPFSSQYAAANAANGIAGIGNVAGVEYASLGLGAGAYVDFDLGSARAITGFDMFDRLFDAERATSFDLIFSNNADMSSPVATRSYSKASSWTASDNFAAPITARYVRYDITAGSGNTGLSDIQFYASEFPGANLGVVVSGTPREVTFAVSGKTGVVSDVTLEWTFNPAQGQAHEAYVELFAPDNTLCDVFRSHVVDDTDIAGPYVFNDAHTALISNVVVSTAGGSVAAGNYRPEYQNVARSFRTTFGGKNPNGVWKLRVQDILSSGFAPTISSANLSIRTAPAPPSIASVAPAVSLLAGGNVTLTGADFSGTPTVTIGGIAATNVTLVNSTTITCTAPVSTVGAKNIVVTNDNGSGTLANGFRYTDLIVTSTADAGAGTLREALSDAQTLSGANTITFAAALSGQTITLTTTPIVVGSGFVTDDTGGVILDASTLSNGLTLTTNLTNTRIFYARTGSLTLKNLTIANAGGAMPGGGIFSSATLTLERCTLNNNSAVGQEGGAIYNFASATLVQCSLTGNVAGNGAAIHNNGTLTVRHCTIAGNTANVGGGIFMQTGMTLENSIVAGNTANVGFDIYNGPSLNLVGANIIPILHTLSGLGGSGTRLTVDPLLGTFGTHGGPTKTFPLLAGSPAINAAVGSSITSDQRGSPLLDAADIGAFESQTNPPTVTSPTTSGVSFTVATVGGNVTSNGAATLSERGVLYALTSVNPDPLIGGPGVTKVVASGTTTGAFTVNLTGLTPGSGYSFKAYAMNSLGTSYTSGGTFSTPVLPVEINVIPTTAQNYGTQRTGVASVARRFTIENLGNAALTLSSVAMTGGNEGDFVVNTTGMLNSVPALGSTTFTVTFNPMAAGARSSTLRILSNDADEGTTDIALSGTGTTIDPPVVSATPISSALLGTSVVLGGEVTNAGGSGITERGLLVTLTSNLSDPYLGASGVTKWTASGTSTGVFSAPVTGLTSGGAYTYRAFATNDGGTSYSNAVNFSTPSNNADLTALTVSSGTLLPSFTTATTSYTMSVANSVTSFTLTPTRASNVATIEARVGVNGFAPATSGGATSPFALAVGANVVQVRVTAEDGSTKTYAITVTRAASTNAGLSALAISTGTLAPAFSVNTLAYTVSVANTVTDLTVTPTLAQNVATLSVNSSPVLSGQASGSIELNIGANPITVRVTAEDGTTVRNHVVTVTRADFPNTAPSFTIPTAAGGVLGATWVPRLNDANRDWEDIAISADGLKIVAIDRSGSIWTSADGGVAWTERTAAGQKDWKHVCSSADGTKLAAAALFGHISTSSDSGATWTQRNASIQGNWSALACDSSGNRLFASDYNAGGVGYTSTNQGATWTKRTSITTVNGAAAFSADGSRLAVVEAASGQLKISTDGGATWTARGTFYGAADMAMSANGNVIYIPDYEGSDVDDNGTPVHFGRVKVSTNGGASFTAVGPNTGIVYVTCSSDGTKVASRDAQGNVHTSNDSGATWTQTPTNPSIYSLGRMRMAGNGSRLVVGVTQSSIFTSVGAASATQSAQAGDPQQTVPGFVTSISPGTRASEVSQTVSFQVTTDNNALFSVLPAITANGTLTYTPASTGSGIATVTIIAQDNGGTANGGVDSSPAQTFAINLSAPDNLDLIDLAISTGTLAPVFDEATTNYTVTLPSTTTSVTLTATVADPGMKLSINGSATTSGSTSAALPLDFGSNTLTATVSNASGTRSKAYSIIATRTPVVPTVTQPQFSAVVATAANLSGNVTTDGGAAITERGIVYALTTANANPEIGGTGVTKINAATNDLGSFTVNVTGLSENSDYSFKAYAINSAGTSYSSVGTFSTPVVTRPEITQVSPSAGITTGGTSVGLIGRYFTGTTGVTIGGVAATGITVVSDTALSFTIPAGTVGAKDIVVTTGIGSGTVRNAFRYADLTVTTNADSGAGTLREALRNAADMAGVNTITFAPALATQTIAVNPIVLEGTGNDNGYVIDDLGGVIIEGNGVTLTRTNVNTNCRVFYLRTGTLTLRGLTLQGAGGQIPGGAIYSSGTLTIERCTLSGNQGDFGGAIYNENGTLTLTQSTLASNTATRGGAIFNFGALTVRHSTIAGNSADSTGGGIRSATAMTLENSIVAGNTAGFGSDIFSDADITRVGVNIVPLLFTNSSLIGSGTILSADPKLSGLAANGGLTRTMLIQDGSPAINAAVGSSITTDQRGLAVNGTPDIGALDVPPIAPVLGLAKFLSTAGTSASVDGIVTSTGGAALTARGFVYALSAANATPTLGGSGVTNVPISGTAVGTFSGSFTGLAAGSAYSFRAYATNSVGTTYSAVVTFSVLSNVADLSALAINRGTLAPAFAAATTSYTASVPAGTSSITLSLATPQSKGSFTVNGGAAVTVPLTVGSNTVTIVVTAENGSTTKTYTLTVTRPAAPPTLGVARTSVAFNQRTITGSDVASEAALTAQGVVFSLSTTNNNPQLGGNGVTAVSGSFDAVTKTITSAAITGMAPGSTYTFAAYATNSAGTGYSSVGVITIPNTNANLSALAISSGTLAPAFAASTLTYTASSAVPTMSVTPTAAAAGSIVKVNGGVVGSGSPSTAIPLVAGINTITILVTAPDGSTQQSYTVAVSRAANPPVLAAATTKSAVLATSATLGGSITEENGGPITERGIVYALTSANNNPIIGGNGVTKVVGSGTAIGAFTVPVTGLAISSVYTFKAYATNSAGSGYSAAGTFTTGTGQPNTPPTFDMPSSAVSPAGATWTQLNNVEGNIRPLDLDVSDDGQQVAVVSTIGSTSSLQLTSDGGTVWRTAQPAADGIFTSVAISNNGQQIFMGANKAGSFAGMEIFRSDNAGATRERVRGSISDTYTQLASSDDGKIVFVVTSQGSVQVSRDFGKIFTWEKVDNPLDRRSIPTGIACSGDGLKGVVGTYGYETLYTFTTDADGKTLTWEERRGPGSQKWSSVAMSKNGSVILGGTSGGGLWVSTDGGVQWKPYLDTPGKNWGTVACSADGKAMAAAVNGGKVWLYTDASKVWSEQITSDTGAWTDLRMSSDGMVLYGVRDEQLWKSVGGPVPYTLTVNPGSGIFTQPAFCKNISPGVNEANQTVSFNVTTNNNALFRKVPTISADGTLSFAPGITAGEATVTVTAQDDGGGTDTSAARSFVIKLRSDDSIGTWASSAWTGDSTSGIVTDRTAWAYDFGSSTASNVNLVSIEGVPTSTFSNANLDLTGPPNVLTGDANNLTSPLARNFVWGGNPTELKLKELIKGQAYVLSLLTVGWDGDAAGQRLLHFGSGSDAIQVDPSSLGANNGTRVSYTFTANATERLIRISQANDNDASFHLYGVALTANSGALNQAPVDVFLFPTSSLPEGNALGQIVGTLYSIDADTQQQHSYELVDGEGGADNFAFAIRGQALVIAVTADRETKSSYTVRVRSTDNGIPKKSFTKALTVTISDVPEPAQDIVLEPPSVDENTPPDTVFATTFRAIGDPDEPTVNFSLPTGPAYAGYDNHFFSCVVGADQKTRLTMHPNAPTRNLDYETKSFYNLRVRGTDRNGAGVFEKDLRLSVNNLFEPAILTGLENRTINEDSSLTLPFTVSHADGALNTLTISASSESSWLVPSANVKVTGTGANRIVTATPLANMSGWAKITVNANDGANTASTSFFLNVLAVNDAPSFNLPGSITLSPAAARAGLANFVTDLNAGPLESDQRMTVSVAYPPGSLLFDASNAPYYRDGVLYAIPKAGQFGTVTLTVTLTDSGRTDLGGSNSFSRTTKITYLDNASPQNLALTSNTLVENSPSGTAVGILSATDPEGKALIFSLSGTGNDNASFEIDTATKTLKTKAGFVPNFEAKSTLTVTVKVTDTDTPAASLEKTFNIAVTDVNEAPTGLTTSPVTMLENLGPNVPVPFNFVVTDPDAGQSHTFEIVPGSTDSSFFKSVDGKILTNANFDFETKPVLSVSVRVKDSGSPPLTFDKTFTVNVGNVNEPPTDILLLTKDGTPASTIIEEGVFSGIPGGNLYASPTPDRRPGTFWFWDDVLQNLDPFFVPFGIIARLGAVNPELDQIVRYEIEPDPATDGHQFVIFRQRKSTGTSGPSTTKLGAFGNDYYLRRARGSVFDSECLSKKTYTVKVRVTDLGLPGDEPESQPASFTKTFAFTLAPADEDILFTVPEVAQNQGDKRVTIGYSLYDPENASCTIAMQWSADDGVTWNTPVSVTGDIGTLPGNLRTGERKQPTDDTRLTHSDRRTIVWNAGQDWNNQFTNKLRVRLTLNGQVTHTSEHRQWTDYPREQITPLNTQGDGPMQIIGYVYNKLTGKPYIPLPGSPGITVTLGNRSVKVGANAAATPDWSLKDVHFKLTNCAPGRLSISHPLFVGYQMDIPAPNYNYTTYLGDVKLTPDTDPPVIHRITMAQAGGSLVGAKDRGIALGGFGVQSKASIDMNWGKARQTGALAQGDELRVYLNGNPNATTDQLLTGGTAAFESVTQYREINYTTKMIDYDKLFRAGTQEGLNNIMVIAKNELGQWSEKPEVRPIYMLPLPGIIDKLQRLPGTGSRRAFSSDQLGFDFGTADLKRVVEYPIIGKWGVEFSTSGSFDYTMSDGNWELAYRGGDLKLFGSQFLNRKINARPGYESPYDDEEEEEDEPFNAQDIFLPKDNFEIGDNDIVLKSIWAATDSKPRIALYMGDREIEAAFFASANGGVSATSGFLLPEIQGALIIRRTGPIVEFPLASVLGIPPKVAKYISPEVTVTAKVDLGGSATLAPVNVPTLNVPVYKPKNATVTGGIDLKVALGIDVDVAGVEAYVGGALKARLGYPSPLLRQLNGRIYAGYEWYVLFAKGGSEITLAQFDYQDADDPDLKKKAAAAAPAMLFAAPAPASGDNELNLSLPDLHVESHRVYPAGPMRRTWRQHGVEHFNLLPVAAPSTQAQAKTAQRAKAGIAAAVVPTPRSGVSAELDVFNRLGRKVVPENPLIQRIISSDPLPAGAELPLLTNIFPYSRQALAESNGNIMLVYPRDTGVADPVHFTEIAYTYYNGTSWTVPGSIAADPRGQTNPQLKVDGTGSFVATWVRLKDLAFQGVGDLEAQAAQTEIISSTFNATTGTWSPAVAITDNNVLDHKTVLAGPLSDGDLLLTWTRNTGNQMNATAAAPDTVLHARWDAATQSWGPASPVASGLVDVTSHGFDASGNRAVYVFTAGDDLHTINWTSGVWSAPVNETGDAVPDKAARVIVQSNGTAITMWNHDGNLVMDRDSSGTPTVVRGGADSGGFTDYALASSSVSGDLILLFSSDIDGQPDAFYRIYDASTQTWSSESRLSNDADLESALVPLWDAQGNLIIAYHNKQLLTTSKNVTLDDGTEVFVEGAIEPGRTDLLLARRLLTTDLNARNVAASGSSFAPGSAVTLTGDLINSGNLPISGATLSFYDGDPQTGGTLITTQTAPGFLYGADTFQASYEWTLPNDSVQHRIYIVADAANTVTEFDETNNSTSRLIGGADLALEYLSGSTSTDGSARIGVQVTNVGSPTSAPCSVEIWRSPVRGAEPLFVAAISALDPAGGQQVALELDPGTLSVGDNAFEIVVNEANMQDERNQGNNSTVTTLTMTAPPSPITGLSDLAISGATLSPSFLTDTTAYQTSVPFDQTSVTVVPTALHFGSTITVNGAPVPSGNASEALTLHSGSTQIVIEVTSQNGANKMSYTVAVHRGVGNADDSGNGSLRALLSIAALRGGPDVIALGREMDGQTITLTSPIVINDPNGVVIDGSALENGVTIEGSGGHRLFEVAANSSLTLICVTLKNGSAAIQNNGAVRVQRCSLIDNTIALNNTSTGTAFIEQSTFAENDGDTIHNLGTASVTFSTFATNLGTSIRSTGTLSVENSIVLNDLIATSVTYLGNNVIPVSTVTTATGPAPLTTDPLLSDLARHGGPTQTFVPSIGSPAIDAAATTTAPIDQRGYPRTLGSHADLGSTEGRILIVTTPLDEFDAIGITGAGYSLREAVRDAENGASILFDRAIFNGSTATTNTITLLNGPLNAANNLTLVGTGNPGGITILANLSITTQPAPQTVAEGGSATFSVRPLAVNGGVAYQWRRDGIDIPGAVSSSYRITNVTEADESVYDVVLTEAEASGSIVLQDVSFAFGQAVSQRASLNVGTPEIRVLGQPDHAILPLGGAHTLSAVFVGPTLPAMTYQWYKDGAAVKNAKSANLTLLNVALTNAGAYTCEAKSGTTAVTTGAAQIAVVDTKPKTVNLLVVGTFTPVLSYKGNELTFAWKRDGLDLGISAATFTLKPLTIANAGLYTCTVTGPGGVMANGFNTRLNVTSTAPTLAPINLPDAFIGQSYYYKVSALPIAGAPATGFTMTGRPPKGITFNTTTGVLSGRPTVTKVGGYNLTFTAFSGKLKSPTRTDNLAVITIDTKAIGTFAGPAPRSPLNGNLGGRFDLTTTATGTFSGSLTLGGRKAIAFRNLLMQVGGAGDQVLTGNISGITMLDKTPLAALVEVFVADQTARLTLTHPNGTQMIVPAWRNPWSTTNLAKSFATNYTVRLDPGVNGEVAPAGYGFASFSVGTNGVARLTGKLPDGSVITGGGFIGRQGELLIFQLLYGTGGSLVGQVAVQKAAILNDNSVAGLLSWSKPVSAKDTLYRNGFAPVSVEVKGSTYVPPAPGQRLLDLAAVTAPATNAAFSFLSVGLSAELRQEVTILNPSATGLTNTAILPMGAPNSFRVTRLDARSGAFAGGFTLPGTTALLNRPATFEGTVVRIDGFAEGYGFFLLPKEPVGSETVKTAPRLSGAVELQAR